MKKIETEMQEKGVEGKNKIKERYNELAQQVTIDADGFVKALLKKKEVSLYVPIVKSVKYFDDQANVFV